MSFEYAAYLMVILLGTRALQFYWKIGFGGKQKQLLAALILTAVFFVAWDALAVAAGHWSFDSRFLIGFFVVNQPIEEIAFFFLVPFFYLTIWEFFKRRKNQ